MAAQLLSLTASEGLSPRVRQLAEKAKPTLKEYFALIDVCKERCKKANGSLQSAHDAKFFLQESKVARLRPCVNMYGSVISCFSKFGEYTESEKLFREFRGTKMTLNIYMMNCLLASFARGNNVVGACRYLAMMPTMNVQPNTVSYSVVIGGFARKGDAKSASFWLEKMLSQNLPPDKVAFSNCIRAYKKQPAEAKKILRQLQRLGGEADEVCYNIVLDSYAASSSNSTFHHATSSNCPMKESVSLFFEMVAANISPSSFTANAILNVFGKQGRFLECYRWMKRFEKRFKIELSTRSLNVALDALAKSECDAAFADMLVRRVRVESDLVTYNSCINIASRRGLPNLALSFFGRLKNAGFDPDYHAVNSVLSAHSRAGDFGGAQKFFDRIVKDGVKPNIYTWNCLLDSYVKQNSISSVVAVTNKIISLGIANVITFNQALSALARKGRYRGALRLLKVSMPKARVAPNSVTYNNILLAAIRFSGSLDFRWLSRMRRKNIPIDTLAYNLLFDVCAKRASPKQASRLLSSMAQDRLQPNHYSYASIITAFANRKDTLGAERIFGYMYKQQLQPKRENFNSLLHAFAEVGMTQKSEEYFKRMTLARINPDDYSINSMIACYQRAGDKDGAARYLQMSMNLQRGSKSSTKSNNNFDGKVAFETVFNSVCRETPEGHGEDRI
eukprot:gene308-1118_t